MQKKKREQRKGEMEREGEDKGGEQERGILEPEVTDYTHVMGIARLHSWVTGRF